MGAPSHTPQRRCGFIGPKSDGTTTGIQREQHSASVNRLKLAALLYAAGFLISFIIYRSMDIMGVIES